MKARRLTPIALTLSLAGLLAATAAALRGQTQPAGDVATYRAAPQKKGRPVDIPRGETLLALFLQQLADATGETVCFKGDAGPEARITVARSMAELDETAGSAVLAQNGLELSRIDYRGHQVIWVQKQIAPPRQKGRILRPGERPSDPQPPAEAERTDRRELAAAAGDAPVKLYAREAGPGPRYVVSFETDSRQEADAVLDILRARALQARERRAGGPTPPVSR